MATHSDSTHHGYRERALGEAGEVIVPHPMLPEIRDEAPKTPTYVPIIGLVLLALVSLMWLIGRTVENAESEDADPNAAAVVEAVEVPAEN